MAGDKSPTPLIAAIVDDPTDLGLRLDFADWLEKHRQIERAKWVRLACEYSHVQCRLEQQLPFWYGRGSGDIPLGPSLEVRLRLKMMRRELLPHFFAKCGPVYWRKISGVRQTLFFGRFILTVMPPPGKPLGRQPPKKGDFDWRAATQRLGRTTWLTDAFQDGWLEALDMPLYDVNHAHALLEWQERSLALPLWVSTAYTQEEGFNDGLLRRILTIPGLRGFEMVDRELTYPCMRRLAELAPNLQYLHVWGLGKTQPSGRLFEQLPRLQHLRMLGLAGTAPNDGQVIPLVAHPRLRHLSVVSDMLTDACLKAFHKARVLRTLTIDYGKFTRQGIQALREANPRLRMTIGGNLCQRFGPM